MMQSSSPSNETAAKIRKDVVNQQDKIFGVCSFHKSNHDIVFIRTRPHEMKMVAKSLQTAFETLPKSGLGNLGHLPVELMTMVLRELDVLSYFRFRQVNRRARLLSTALQEYRLVALHGLEGLRGLLRSKTACNFEIADLYKALITPTCGECGKFGGSLYLPRVMRSCFGCITSSAQLSVVSLSALSSASLFTAKRLKKIIPCIFHTVPGTYSSNNKPVRRPKLLIPLKEAMCILVSYDFTLLESRSMQHLVGLESQAKYRLMVSTVYPWYDPATGQVERGVSCKGCHYLVSIGFGLVATKQEKKDSERKFTKAGFMSHFKQCKQAQRMWIESENGTKYVEGSVYAENGGSRHPLGPNGLPR